jgi:flavin-dependent dehydrogenase
MKERSLTLVGGGLAGLSLGIALRRRGIPVTLHEAGRYPRHRVCGEFIRGVTEETLGNLGLKDCFEGARIHRDTAWFRASGERVMAATLPSPATGISRHRLDRRLAGLFTELGGSLAVDSRKSPRKDNDEGWVWTAGRRADKAARWLGLKMHFSNLPLQVGLEMHLGRHGYVGLSGIEEERVNVCGLFRLRGNARGRGPALLFDYLREGGFLPLAKRLREADGDPESFTGISAFRLGRQRGDDGLCALGDAERMIPPFTGNGMSMAFESAECALDPLTDFASGMLPWAACQRAISKSLEARFQKRVAAARLMHPWLMGNHLPRLTSGLMRTGLVPFSLLTRLVT